MIRIFSSIFCNRSFLDRFIFLTHQLAQVMYPERGLCAESATVNGVYNRSMDYLAPPVAVEVLSV